jgi:hypothetical protein
VKGFVERCVSNAVDESEGDLCSVHGPTRCTFFYVFFILLYS